MLCNLCAKKCNKERTEVLAEGNCHMPLKIKIAHYELFQYEEPCISINKGSGAIFFSGCNLDCVFCQNYEISEKCKGKFITTDEFIEIIKELEAKGAENINLVSPTHYALAITQALKKYKPKVPVIYNTNAYENIETIKMVAPFVDVFLPDFKYYDDAIATRFSGAKNYYNIALNAIKCMRELKLDVFDETGKILQGVIVRHMVLPLCTNDSIKVLNRISKELPNTKVSLLAQYTPCGRASEFKEINRKITKREYEKVLTCYYNLNLTGYVQDLTSATKDFIPKFRFCD